MGAQIDACQTAIYARNIILQDYFIRATELPPYGSRIRFDVIGIKKNRNIDKAEIRILEIKSCRSDFKSDKKWQGYLKYCTHFAFVAPVGVIKKEELPPGIGLIEVVQYDSTRFTHRYVRNCRRLDKGVDRDNYIKILEAIATRVI